MTARLKKDNAFRLRRSLFYWDRGYDAPFVREVYNKLLLHMQNKFPDIEWPEEIAATRRDISRIKEWGELPIVNQKCRIELKVYGFSVDLQVNKIAWVLLYPDYLLITYPVWPPGTGKLMLPDKKDDINPIHFYPSRFWHLPEQVYQYFEGIYGERGYENISDKVYAKFVATRQEYCQYFARKYKLPTNYFSRITGARVTQERPDLSEIFSIN